MEAAAYFEGNAVATWRLHQKMAHESDQASPRQVSWMSPVSGIRDSVETSASFGSSARTTPTHVPTSPETPGQRIREASSFSPRGELAGLEGTQALFSAASARGAERAEPLQEPVEIPREQIESPRSGTRCSSQHLLAAKAAAEGAVTATKDATSTSVWYRQQAEWDRQMQFHDRRQSDLLKEQFALVREHTGTLAQELAICQKQVKDLKSDSLRMVVEVQQFIRESEAKHAEERSSKQQLSDTIEQRFQKVIQSLDAEAKLRAAGFQEVHPKLVAIEQLLEAKTKEQCSLAQEVSRMGNAVGGNAQDIRALKDSLLQEASARRSQEESTLDVFRKLREECRKDVQALMAQHEEQWRSHLSVFDMERLDRQQSYSALRDKITALDKDVLPLSEDVPALRSRLCEVEKSMAMNMMESQTASAQETADRLSAQHALEGRVNELSALVEKEQLARVRLTEDCERLLQNVRDKVKGMIVEQADVSRHAREELQSLLTSEIKQETAIREAQNASLLDRCTGHRSAMDARADTLDAAMRQLEQRYKVEFASMCSQQRDAWTRGLREQEDLLLAKIIEERGRRELQGAALEEHIDFFGRFYKEISQVFQKTGSYPRIFEPRKAESAALGSCPSRAPSPGRLGSAEVVGSSFRLT